MSQKKIAVLGTGNGAHTIAFDLTQRGHLVNLFILPALEPRVPELLKSHSIEAIGLFSGTQHLNLVTEQIDEAIDGADYICIAAPAYRHEEYARTLKGHVKKDQTIVVFSGAFAPFLFKNIFAEETDCPIIAVTNTLPFCARLAAPGKVNVLCGNSLNVAFFPADAGQKFAERFREDLYPFKSVYSDVLECGLSLVNPTFHCGPCLTNLGNIERPDVRFFMYEHGWTASGLKINMMVDQERKSLGQAFGYRLQPIEDYSGRKELSSWEDWYCIGHGNASLTSIEGPNSIYDRYLYEDIPCGLVPWYSLAETIGIDMPVTHSVIRLIGIAHGRDWLVEGHTVKKLGLSGKNISDIQHFVKSGKFD